MWNLSETWCYACKRAICTFQGFWAPINLWDILVPLEWRHGSGAENKSPRGRLPRVKLPKWKLIIGCRKLIKRSRLQPSLLRSLSHFAHSLTTEKFTATCCASAYISLGQNDRWYGQSIIIQETNRQNPPGTIVMVMRRATQDWKVNTAHRN